MHKHLIVAAFVLLALAPLVRADDQPTASEGALKLADQMTAAVQHQDVEAAVNLLNMDAFIDAITAGDGVPEDFKTGFKQAFPAQVHNIIATIVKDGGAGSYHFLRVRQVDGQTRVLFRMLGADSGLNYHDWVVAPNPQGVLKFNDVYVAISGELLSATAHRAYIQGALAANPGLLDRLTGKDKELGDNFAKLAKMADASQAKQYQQVLDTYNTLPAAMQGEKSCMILRLVAAEQLREPSSDQYAAAMADYQRLFPGDPSVDLDCLDGLFFKKKFDDARTSIDGIDNFTGGDPYLQILRGATYKLEGGDRNLLRAKRCYQKAIDEEPTLADGYWSLVALSLDAHDYDETATLLTQIRQKLHMRINDLTKLPTYAGFVQSPAYTKWLAAQPASQAPATQPQ